MHVEVLPLGVRVRCVAAPDHQLGTAEVLRFASRVRGKRVVLLSTVGLAEGLARSAPIREEESAAALWPTRPRHGQGVGQGYTTTKWAAELLAEHARARLGSSVDIVRCSNLMAHPDYRGQINAADAFSRLLCGLAHTGIAPASFYSEGSEAPFIDGLPVGFAATAIVDLALRRTAGGSTFHLAATPGASAASLDTLASCLTEAGIPVRTIADYDAWYSEFRERLQRLGATQRRHSPLAIASRWERPARRTARLDTTHTLRFRRAPSSFRGRSAAW